MEKEVSCINTKAIFDYLKEKYQGDYSSILHNLDPDINVIPDPIGFLKDPNNWISCRVASELYKRTAVLMADETVAYKVAKFAVERTSLGYAQRILVKAFWSHEKALKHAQRINDKWNRNKKVELVEIKRNGAVVRLHWDSNMEVSKHLCLMNQGTYTHLPLIWGGRPLTLNEVCCSFEGAPYCEYHLRWPARNRIHEIFSRFISSKSVLMETIREMEAGKKIIEQKYEEVSRLNLELHQRIRQLTAIQETGKAIVSVLELDHVLQVIMNLLSSVCKINRAVIMLVNEEKGCLEYKYGIGLEGTIPERIVDYKVPIDRVSNLLARVVNTGRSEYIPEISTSSLKKDNIILTDGKPLSAFVVPLISRSKVIGVLATDAVDGTGVPKDTRETLEIFAPQIAIAIENAKLYSSLQERIRELKRSQALLSRAEKFSFLGNLAARLAHEIKNPLTAIGTFIQLLPTRYDDEEFRKDFYKIAMEETIRMNNLITELLDLVKPKESHFAHGNIHELIDKMILLVSPQSKAKKIEIVRKFDGDLGEIWMDSEKIKQLMLNLLSNALDFTPNNGKIEIATSKSAELGKLNSLRIEVKDNGVGIPAANMDKIFDPYFTTKHKSSMHSGTGLGLFIAYQHVRDHFGTIEAKSKMNEGTTFIVSLPLSPEQLSSPENTPQ
jgi:signal transduction histidine kinase